MTLPMYALRDELNGFTSPIPFNNEEMAKRYLKDQVYTNPTIKNTTKDFSLWKIGEYDTETGLFIQNDDTTAIKLIERAENYVTE